MLREGMRQDRESRKVVLVAVVVVLVLALLIPIRLRCGAPGFSCASTVDTQGYAHYYYEVEPLGVALVEFVTNTNIRLYYKSGEELVKVRAALRE